MLFQLSPKFHLRSIFPSGPIVGQDEVGVHAVENSELAHGIGHGLVWPDYISSNQVLLVFHNPPGGDTYGAYLPTRLRCMVLQGISNMANDACVHPSCEDPRSGCHCCLDEPFPEDLLEFGLELKVLQAAVDRDEKLGELQLPFLGHQVEEEVRFRIKRYSHVHGFVGVATSLELNGPKSIRWAELSVFADGPLLRLDVISGETTFVFLILKHRDTGSESDMLAYQTPTATPMGVFGAGYDVNTFSFIKCSFYPGFLSLKKSDRREKGCVAQLPDGPV